MQQARFDIAGGLSALEHSHRLKLRRVLHAALAIFRISGRHVSITYVKHLGSARELKTCKNAKNDLVCDMLAWAGLSSSALHAGDLFGQFWFTRQLVLSCKWIAYEASASLDIPIFASYFAHSCLP